MKMKMKITEYEINNDYCKFPFPKTERVFVICGKDINNIHIDEIVEGQEIMCPRVPSEDSKDIEYFHTLLAEKNVKNIVHVRSKMGLSIFGYTYIGQ